MQPMPRKDVILQPVEQAPSAVGTQEPLNAGRGAGPEGQYLRRWLPELAALDHEAIHAPWKTPPLQLAAAQVVLGVHYPEPIVDHDDARSRTLDAYRAALAGSPA